MTIPHYVDIFKALIRAGWHRKICTEIRLSVGNWYMQLLYFDQEQVESQSFCCRVVCQLSCQYNIYSVTCHIIYYYCCILRLCVPAVKCDHRSFVQNVASVS